MPLLPSPKQFILTVGNSQADATVTRLSFLNSDLTNHIHFENESEQVSYLFKIVPQSTGSSDVVAGEILPDLTKSDTHSRKVPQKIKSVHNTEKIQALSSHSFRRT